MLKNNYHNEKTQLLSHTDKPLPVLEKTKSAYLLWYQYYQAIPKQHKFSLGEKIDKFFVEIIDAVVTANFLSQKEKIPFVRFAIRRLDVLKVFLMMLWETKSLDNKKYISLSEKLNEIGRNLGGWHGKLIKENSLNGEK
ncbi:MAG: four helix bundle protein [Phycisphaerae bacterium]|nr:four helix bundle protein [Phycisphaerae bacterium]